MPSPEFSTAFRVLLVEDHQVTRLALAVWLNKRGYDVAAVGSVADALIHARVRGFDFLICDVALPDGSGLSLIHQLRLLRDFHAIAISGEVEATDSLAAGYSEHFEKPLNLGRLEEILKAA